MENYESAEADFEPASKNTSSTKSGKKSSKGPSNKSNGSTGSAKKYHCLKHGPNNTHDTDDCKVLQSMVKGEGSKSKNKTWKKDQDKDMSAVVKKYVRKELHALTKSDDSNKKRKVSKDLNAIEESSENDDLRLEDIDFDQLEGMSYTSEQNDDESFHTASDN